MICRDGSVGAAGQTAPTKGYQPPLKMLFVVVWAVAREGLPVSRSHDAPQYSGDVVHVSNADEFTRQMLKMVADGCGTVSECEGRACCARH